MKIFQWIILIAFICLALFVAFYALMPNPPSWTGFGEKAIDQNKESAKTLWDWLELLIIPTAIGVFGWFFKNSEKAKAQIIEEERAQNSLLESFIESMTNLIINNNLTNNPERKIKVIAKTNINMALTNLNGPRKGQILQFLYESFLIRTNPLVELHGANLKTAILDEIVLTNSEIRGAYFNNASLISAKLDDAILAGCDFSGADLSKSSLINTDLSYSYLTKATLNDVDLTSVNFEGANLKGAKLNRCTINQAQLDMILEKEGIKISKCQVL